MITEKGKKPYIKEVNEKIGKIYLAKKNPRVKYKLVEEKIEEAKATKKETKEDPNFGKPRK